MNAPSVRIGDIDAFEDRLRAFVKAATPTELRRAVNQACQWLEKGAEDARMVMPYVNNATSTACTVATELSVRLKRADELTRHAVAQELRVSPRSDLVANPARAHLADSVDPYRSQGPGKRWVRKSDGVEVAWLPPVQPLPEF
jgi:hypothetical protein